MLHVQNSESMPADVQQASQLVQSQLQQAGAMEEVRGESGQADNLATVEGLKQLADIYAANAGDIRLQSQEFQRAFRQMRDYLDKLGLSSPGRRSQEQPSGQQITELEKDPAAQAKSPEKSPKSGNSGSKTTKIDCAAGQTAASATRRKENTENKD